MAEVEPPRDEDREKRNAELVKLLAPIWGEDPVGKNLEYDVAYQDLARLAAGTPEQVSGSSVIPGVDPEWPAVAKAAHKLALQTKDLRVLVHLVTAWLKTEGLLGFRDGVFLLKGTIEAYWDKLYPNLDPDDDNDPTERMSILRVFASSSSGEKFACPMVRDLKAAPLTNSQQVGRFGLKDIAAASNPGASAAKIEESTDGGTVQKIDMALIEASAKDPGTSVFFLEKTRKYTLESIELVLGLEVAIDKLVQLGRGIDFKEVVKTLKEAATQLQKFLALKGVGGPVDGATEDATDPVAGETVTELNGGTTGGGTSGSSARTGAVISGEVRSRADVIKMLDKICAYYTKVEPSSPVPLLLQRARRLVDKDFWGVISDLCQDAQATITTITGYTPPDATGT